MFTSVYLHPMRTICMSWDTTNGIATLHDYKEFQPITSEYTLSDTFHLVNNANTEITVVVHTSHIRYHTFPYSTAENLEDRKSFEIREFLGGSLADNTVVRTVHHKGLSHNANWMSLLILPPHVKGLINTQFGTDAEIMVDIEADIQAAKHDGDVVLLGMRGEFLWALSLNELKAPYHLEQFPVHRNSPFELQLEEAFVEHTAPLEHTWKKMRLFGDALTPMILQKVGESIVGNGKSVARFNPFPHVRAEVSNEVQDSIIKRAHILSPLAGAALRASSPVLSEA